jgi:hypothetical protein
MSRYRSCAVLFCVAAAFSLAVVAGCDRGAKRIVPAKVANPAKAAEEAMKMYDANQDGKLDAQELKQISALAQLAKDGAVTADLIEKQLKEWAQGAIGRVQWGVVIVHNGKPIVGADVKFVPEKFMGENYPVPTGKTNNIGFASMSVQVSALGEPKGIPLGFYRLEVTKDGESIPAKYNTESTISLGVFTGQAGGGGPTFNLVY